MVRRSPRRPFASAPADGAPWPAAVNLELDSFGLPLACVRLGGFRAKLLFMMLAPLVILLLTKAIGWCRRDRSHERELRQKVRQPPPCPAHTPS